MHKDFKPSLDTHSPLEETTMRETNITANLEQCTPILNNRENAPSIKPFAEAKPKKKASPNTIVNPIAQPPIQSSDQGDLDDEFSPENLRLLNKIDLKDLITAELVELPARKPKKDEWFRVHPEYQQQGGILEIDSEKKVFWVTTKIQPQVMHDPCFTFRLCVLCVTRQGVPFIWPVKTDVEAGGSGDKFVRIPFAAMTYGREKWTRLYWSQEKREHQIETSDLLDEPKFPDKPFPELLKLAFKGSVISTADHPAILNLKGKAR